MYGKSAAEGGLFFGLNNVKIDPRKVLALERLYRTSAHASNVIHYFVDTALQSGIDIEMAFNGDKSLFGSNPKTKEKVQEYINTVLTPKFRMVLIDCLVRGYSKLIIEPPKSMKKNDRQNEQEEDDEDEDDPMRDFPTFHRLRDKETAEYLMWTEYQEKRLVTQWSTQFLKLAGKGEKIEGGITLVMHMPDDNGNLTSPLQFAFEEFVVAQRLTDHHLRASHTRANPWVYVFPEHQKIGNSSALEGNIAVQGPMGRILGTQAARELDIRRIQAEDNFRAIAALREARAPSSGKKKLTPNENDMGMLSEMVSKGIPTKVAFAEAHIPWERQYQAPRGFRPMNPPTAMGPEEYLQSLQQHLSVGYRAFNVPPELLLSIQRGKMSADLTNAIREFGTSIKEFQNAAAPLLSKLLRKMFTPMFYPDVKRVAKEHKKETDVKAIQEIAQSIDIKAVFVHRPIMSLDILIQLYESGVINGQVFSRYAIHIVGLHKEDGTKDPIDELLTRNKKELAYEVAREKALVSVRESATSSSSSSSSSPSPSSSASSVKKRPTPSSSEKEKKKDNKKQK